MLLPDYEPTADDADWRTLPDPHSPDFRWRCKNLVLEFQLWTETNKGPWRTMAQSREALGPLLQDFFLPTTPERRAVWRELFINPANDPTRTILEAHCAVRSRGS